MLRHLCHNLQARVWKILPMYRHAPPVRRRIQYSAPHPSQTPLVQQLGLPTHDSHYHLRKSTDAHHLLLDSAGDGRMYSSHDAMPTHRPFVSVYTMHFVAAAHLPTTCQTHTRKQPRTLRNEHTTSDDTSTPKKTSRCSKIKCGRAVPHNAFAFQNAVSIKTPRGIRDTCEVDPR